MLSLSIGIFYYSVTPLNTNIPSPFTQKLRITQVKYFLCTMLSLPDSAKLFSVLPDRKPSAVPMVASTLKSIKDFLKKIEFGVGCIVINW